MRRQLLFVIATALAAAAAALAGPLREPVQPPTPARNYTFEQLWAIPVPANERYYVVVFGSQSSPKRPRFTHTWVTAVRATWTVGQAEPILETHTISWMPATLHIRTLSRHTEPGVNLGMSDSVRIMQDMGERVTMWGPYEMRPYVYQRFLIQKAFIDSGAVGYQCIDKWGEAGRLGVGCDCIHAVTDLDPDFNRSRYPLRLNGEAASLHIVEQLARRGTLVSGPQLQDWLRPRLGLDHVGIVPGSYNGPVDDQIPANRLPYLFPATKSGPSELAPAQINATSGDVRPDLGGRRLGNRRK